MLTWCGERRRLALALTKVAFPGHLPVDLASLLITSNSHHQPPQVLLVGDPLSHPCTVADAKVRMLWCRIPPPCLDTV